MGKYTKGPWKAELDAYPVYVYAEPSQLIVCDVRKVSGDKRPRREANARLIAAAPTLLEACQALLASGIAEYADGWYCEWCDRHAPKHELSGEIVGVVSHHDDCPIVEARAAIKAAEGLREVAGG